MKRLIVLMTAILLTVSCTKITTEPKQDKDIAIELCNKQTPGWIPTTTTTGGALPDTAHAKPDCVPPPPGHGLNGNQGGRDIKPPRSNPDIITIRPRLVAPHIPGEVTPPVKPAIVIPPNSLNDGVNKEIPAKF